MNQLLVKLIACAFGLALCGTVIAADQSSEKDPAPLAAQPTTDEPAAPVVAEKDKDMSTQSDPQAAPNDKPASVAADKSNKPEEVSEAYTAALKKCKALTGTQKDTCEKKAKTDHGEM